MNNKLIEERDRIRALWVLCVTEEERETLCKNLLANGDPYEWFRAHPTSYRWAVKNEVILRHNKRGAQEADTKRLAKYRDQIHDLCKKHKVSLMAERMLGDMLKDSLYKDKLSPKEAQQKTMQALLNIIKEAKNVHEFS